MPTRPQRIERVVFPVLGAIVVLVGLAVLGAVVVFGVKVVDHYIL
jgi:hypothetical protein